MITDVAVRLARLADAAEIATMSRDYIERGLPWTWTEARVAHAIRDPETNVVVVRESGALLGFGIMFYASDDAHLLLFAVRRAHQRRGVGSAILRWLEDVARDRGREAHPRRCLRENSAARNFYCEHGYHELDITQKFYRGLKDGVHLEKWLRDEDSLSAQLSVTGARRPPASRDRCMCPGTIPRSPAESRSPCPCVSGSFSTSAPNRMATAGFT